MGISNNISNINKIRAIGIDLGTINSAAAQIARDPASDAPPSVRVLEIEQPTREGSYTSPVVPSFFGEREPTFKVFFRASAVNPSPKARLELERFRRYVEDYMHLEEATGRRLELAPLYSGRLSPMQMAAEERRRIGLGDEPVRDLFALLERNGLRILREPLPSEVEISGVFVFLEAQNAMK